MKTTQTPGPWAEQFLPLPTVDDIRKRVTVTVTPTIGLFKQPIDVARKTFDQALGALYLPSDEDLRILLRLYTAAYVYARSTYTTVQAFNARCQEPKHVYPPEADVICLTGPAGAGKSAIIAALERIRRFPSTLLINPDADPFRFKPFIPFKMRSKIGQKLTAPLVESLYDRPARTVVMDDVERELVKACHRFGACMLLPDELQHVTHSQDANALVTKTLLGFSYLGPPVTYVANYSLVWRLVRRNQEDTQRLIADSELVGARMPDLPYLKRLFAALIATAPDCFDLDADAAAEAFGMRLLGNRRLIRALLRFAFILGHQVGRKVDIVLLDAAYNSEKFTKPREDALETLRLIADPSAKTSRPDLRCPFEPEGSVVLQAREAEAAERDRQIAAAAYRARLPVAERGAFDAAYVGLVNTTASKDAIKGKSTTSATVSNLLKNAAKFREGLNKR